MPEPRPAGRSFVRWYILALLVAASFIAYILRTNMSVAGERMMTELGFSQVQLGVVLAAFAWGYALFQLPGGILGDRLGGRKALALIIVAWGVINILTGMVPHATSPLAIVASLAAMRFLMGVAQAPVYPITGGQAIARWFPPDGWAFPNALTNTGLTFGSAATGPLIAWLVERLGWRLSFVVTGPIAFVMAAVWWWYARDRPEQHPGVRAGELAIINAGRREAGVAGEDPGAWRTVLRDRRVLLITGSYFLDNYVFYFFFNWLYVYLVDVRKFTALQGGAMAAAPWIVGAFGAAVGGYVCDAITRRRGIGVGTRSVGMVGLLLASGFIVLAARAGNPYVAVVWLSLCLAAQQATDSAYWAACTAVGGRHAAAACGVMNTGGNVVGGIGALLVPYLAQTLGWPSALGTVSVFGVLGAVLWLWINAGHRVEPA